MGAKNHSENDERAKKTLYVTGFNSKYTTKRLLKELFTQGGPVADITMFDSHAYVRFQDEESVPYSLALLNEVELFGDKLRLNPRYKSGHTFRYMKYLAQVRDKLRDENKHKEPPKLPTKKYSETPKKSNKSEYRQSANKQRHKKNVVNHTSAHNSFQQKDKPHVNSKKLTESKNKRGKRSNQNKNRRPQKIVKTLKRWS